MVEELLLTGEIETADDDHLGIKTIDEAVAEKFHPKNYDKLQLIYTHPDAQYLNGKTTTVNWDLGNTCTYACTYCHPSLHDGSIGWPELDYAIKAAKKVTDHYKGQLGRYMSWVFLGGEVIVWKNFLPFIQAIKEYDNDATIVIITNGKRTLRWWNKAKHYIDEICFTVHIEFADIEEMKAVINEVGDTVGTISIQIPAIPSRWDECIEAINVLKEANWYNSLRLKFLYNHLTSHVGSAKAYQPEERLGYQAIIDGKEIIERYTPEQMATINNLVHSKKPDASFKRSPKLYRRLCAFKKDENGAYNKPLLDKIQWHKLIGYKANSWRGWKCHAGIESLTMDRWGGMRVARCAVYGIRKGGEGKVGNWKTGLDSIDWPTEPVTCPFEYCGCGADITITKEKK